MKGKIFILISLTIFSLYLLENARAIDISTCSVLDTAGATYTLTANIINSATSYCMNISANNIILDCQNHIIDGNDVADYGIYVYRSAATTTNITIKNCILTDWDTANIYLKYANGNVLENISSTSSPDSGLYLYYSGSNSLTNITANSNTYYGLYLYYSDLTKIQDSTFKDNAYWDVWFDTSADWKQEFINIKGTDDKPIVYYNSSVTIENWYNNVSEIILGNADNSTLKNITMDRTGTENNGILLVDVDNSSLTDLNLIDLEYGIHLRQYSDSNSLTNITANSNTYGLYLDSYSDSNTIKNSRFQDNVNYGIYLYMAGNPANSIYNNLFNNTANFYFDGTIYANYWNTTRQAGTRIYSPGTEIGGNYWTNSTGNGYSDTCTDADKDGFCDNYYELTAAGPNRDYLPLSDEYPTPPTYSLNSTNSTIAGTAIEHRLKWTDNVGLSYAIFSFDNCTGSLQNITGMSLSGTSAWSNFTVTINSTAGCTIKWRAYANDTSNNWNASAIFSFTTLPTYCDYSIQEWGLPYTINKNNSYYCLASNEYIAGQTAISFASGIQNSTLDCLNYNLDGNDYSSTYGVYLTGSNTKNNTVKNCNITDFDYGIFLESSSNNTVYNNTVSSSINYGIVVYSSSNNNTIQSNTANNNGWGILLHTNSNYNTIIGNTAKNNTGGGVDNSGIILYSFCNNNILKNNTANFNDYGIYLYKSSNNTITNSTAKSNNGGGFSLLYSNSSKITNCTSSFNGHGLSMIGDSNTIDNCTIDSNTNYGIYLDESNSNIIANSIIQNNTKGIRVYSAGGSGPNKIYNNLLNNTINTEFTGTIYLNYWNTTRQTGDRIYSAGTEIGGNYWTNSTGNGYSDTCTDSDKDGFCDNYYELHATGPNRDYLPLSDEYSVAVITNCNITGYSLYYNNGTLTKDATITSIVKETGDRRYSDFSNGYFNLGCYSPINHSTNKFTMGIIINSSDEKISYNQLIIGSGGFATQTQKCSTKRWHFQGQAIDSSSSSYIAQGNITAGIDGISGTNTTWFSNGIWDIYYSPCLISGEIYTFKFIITSGDRRSYMFLNQVAK